jgi:hypothetical protein
MQTGGFLCVMIKHYGLLLAELDPSDSIKVFKTLKHPYINGILPTKSKQYGVFNIGVLVDNQADEDVKEFYFEVAVNAIVSPKLMKFQLSRVFIASEKVKAVQTNVEGSVTTFLMGSNVYIVPVNIHGLNLLPYYVYTKATDSSNISYVNINTDKVNTIIFKLLKTGEEGDEIITFNNLPADRESFTCQFKKDGNYIASILKHHADIIGEVKPVFTNYSVKIAPPAPPTPVDPVDPVDPEDDKDKKKKKDEDKEKPKPDEDDEEGSGNTTLVVILVVVSIVVVIGIIAVILYVRNKKRQSASGNLVEAGNYRLQA